MEVWKILGKNRGHYNCQPKQCTIKGKSHRFALFHPPKMGNLMISEKPGPENITHVNLHQQSLLSFNTPLEHTPKLLPTGYMFVSFHSW